MRSKQHTYIAKDHDTGLYKIGFSINPEKRVKQLKRDFKNIELIHTIPYNIEWRLHDEFNNKRVKGEWFELTDLEVKDICNRPLDHRKLYNISTIGFNISGVYNLLYKTILADLSNKNISPDSVSYDNYFLTYKEWLQIQKVSKGESIEVLSESLYRNILEYFNFIEAPHNYPTWFHVCGNVGDETFLKCHVNEKPILNINS
jgi:hypothetical protein